MSLVVWIIRPMWPGHRLRKVGLVLVGLCGPALVLAGLSPDDVRQALHHIAGGVQFPAQNIGLILLGFAAIRTKPSLGWFTLLCGVVGMVVLIFQGTPPYIKSVSDTEAGSAWRGYPFAIWTIARGASALAVYAIARSARADA